MKKALIVASVGAMIEDFNSSNIEILQELGYEVHIAANFNPNNDKQLKKSRLFLENMKKTGVTSYQLDFQRGIGTISSNVKVYKQLLNIMRQNNYKIVHCHSPIGGVLTRLAGKRIRQNNIVYTAHGFQFFKGASIKDWIIYYSLEQILSRFTDIVITINDEDYDRANKMGYKTVYKIPGVGINYDRYAYPQKNNIYKKSDLGIPENSFVIISVGELRKIKNHQVIINAISQLEYKNVYYLLCGVGEEKSYLEDLSKRLGVEEKVRFLGYRQDIENIYPICDLCAFPSTREGLGLAAIEAMAAGLPLITSDRHGINDYSINAVTGYKCSPKDVETFSENIERFIVNEEIRLRIANDNKKVAQCFDGNKINLIMKDIYRQI